MDDLLFFYLLLLVVIWIPYLCRGNRKEEEWIIEAVIPPDFPSDALLLEPIEGRLIDPMDPLLYAKREEV